MLKSINSVHFFICVFGPHHGPQVCSMAALTYGCLTAYGKAVAVTDFLGPMVKPGKARPANSAGPFHKSSSSFWVKAASNKNISKLYLYDFIFYICYIITLIAPASGAQVLSCSVQLLYPPFFLGWYDLSMSTTLGSANVEVSPKSCSVAAVIS